jgi:hypothetical protein
LIPTGSKPRLEVLKPRFVMLQMALLTIELPKLLLAVER